MVCGIGDADRIKIEQPIQNTALIPLMEPNGLESIPSPFKMKEEET